MRTISKQEDDGEVMLQEIEKFLAESPFVSFRFVLVFAVFWFDIHGLIKLNIYSREKVETIVPNL